MPNPKSESKGKEVTIRLAKKVMKVAKQKAKALDISKAEYLAGVILGKYPKITDKEADAETTD